jgi:hypothetical protein
MRHVDQARQVHRFTCRDTSIFVEVTEKWLLTTVYADRQIIQQLSREHPENCKICGRYYDDPNTGCVIHGFKGDSEWKPVPVDYPEDWEYRWLDSDDNYPPDWDDEPAWEDFFNKYRAKQDPPPVPTQDLIGDVLKARDKMLAATNIEPRRLVVSQDVYNELQKQAVQNQLIYKGGRLSFLGNMKVVLSKNIGTWRWNLK